MHIGWIITGFLFAAVTAMGQAPAAPPGGTNILPEGGMKIFKLGARDPKVAEATLVDAEQKSAGQILRLRTNTKPDNPWLIQAQARSVIALQKGDVCLATFRARATETSDEMGEGTLGVVFEHVGAPNTKSLQKSLKLNKDWRQFSLPFAMADDEAAGQAQCNLLAGYMPQTIEVADFQLVTYRKTKTVAELPLRGSEVNYRGREPDAAWRKQAQQRIENHRKAGLTVVVTDADGKPVRDAVVKIDLERHAYHFGAAVTAQMLTADTDDAKRYRQIVQDNFNAVVLENDLKYNPWVIGKTSATTAAYNYQNTITALHWLKDRNIFVRGHCLLWGPLDKRFYQAARGFDFDAADPSDNRKLIDEYVTDILKSTEGLIGEWDAVNHPIATWGDKGRTWETLFGKEFYRDIFQKARAGTPKGTRLFINEGADFPGDNESARKAYEDIIAWLVQQKAPLDGIGFMSHFGPATLATPQYIYAHLERYGKFGLPMRSTELDVSTDGDEKVQADYYRDFMTMFFSHPQTDGIIMWGFWEGRHWKPDAALWRKNWEIKPAGQAWLDLVKKQWWTNAQGRTDATGQFNARGFKGTYTVTVTAGGQTHSTKLELTSDGARCVVPLGAKAQ